VSPIVEITPFPAGSASDALIREYYDLSAAAFQVDLPGRPLLTFEAMAARVRSPLSPYGPHHFYQARLAGRLVAVAVVMLPDSENTDVAVVEVRVHPDQRRHGIGSQMLRHLLPDLRARGRRMLTHTGFAVGGTGQGWAEWLGASRAHAFVLQDLEVGDVDPRLWAAPAPAGYRIESWRDSAPERLLASYAAARNAMHDAPTGDMTFEVPQWTPQRVRKYEADARDGGRETFVVVGIAEATCAVGGYTEMVIFAGQPTRAMQFDTAVRAEHRGHGLGVALKSAMMRWITREHPNVERVSTNTGIDNVHMIRVNHQLGYLTNETVAVYEVPVDQLTRRLTPTG